MLSDLLHRLYVVQGWISYVLEEPEDIRLPSVVILRAETKTKTGPCLKTPLSASGHPVGKELGRHDEACEATAECVYRVGTRGHRHECGIVLNLNEIRWLASGCASR
jgi:hypothetical protein